MMINYFSALFCHFRPIPLTPERIEKTGERRLKKVNGIKAKTGTPRVEAAKEPATPQGIR
ncbi:hypothetical protein LGAS_1497 [Lactobacillus gasseri ATCC 33323 = JCM 1131]|uniref:Uncharacterized protein n=1 Tax=Lactobacillus gasseri (strain ATCC 33323 / DSM 20243 / BCRC 14619 / CIP 102991 / JCM 1131 / KCTC 3163 / NCIMB 11718 / NCTC 13722 / AM63) TaxID=324831 RepID=A0A805Z0E4_LACGA|nr:hypothetical protein LGAS_1497 [Lactobacillus gasseri ATCC 33323 = JCM 1131]